MRMIEQEIIQAIRDRKDLQAGHSSEMQGYRDVITFSPAGFSYRLWDNYIAVSSDGTKTLVINDCGYPTATTRSRLNAIFAAMDIPMTCSVRKKKLVYYLNGIICAGLGNMRIETGEWTVMIS